MNEEQLTEVMDKLDTVLVDNTDHVVGGITVMCSLIAMYYKGHQEECTDHDCDFLEVVRDQVRELLTYLEHNPKKDMRH